MDWDAFEGYTSGLYPLTTCGLHVVLENDMQFPLCNEFDDDVTTTTCKNVSSVRFLGNLHQPPPRANAQLSQGMPAMHLSRTAVPPRCAAHSSTHAPAPPHQHRPALRLHHTHRRRHRCSLRSFTHAPARSRCCHIARHNLVSPLCPLPTPTCAVVCTHL